MVTGRHFQRTASNLAAEHRATDEVNEIEILSPGDPGNMQYPALSLAPEPTLSALDLGSRHLLVFTRPTQVT